MGHSGVINLVLNIFDSYCPLMSLLETLAGHIYLQFCAYVIEKIKFFYIIEFHKNIFKLKIYSSFYLNISSFFFCVCVCVCVWLLICPSSRYIWTQFFLFLLFLLKNFKKNETNSGIFQSKWHSVWYRNGIFSSD